MTYMDGYGNVSIVKKSLTLIAASGGAALAETNQREATIRDVARLAGCGIATVSRVLNESGPVSDTSRRLVVDAARELGFEFSDVGRSLRNAVTRTIGCVVPSINNPVYAAAVQGIQTVARANGHQLLLSCTGYDLDEEYAAVKTLIGKRVDALILTMSDIKASRAVELLHNRKLKHCLLFNHMPGIPQRSAVDNCSAGFRVGLAFAEAGHDRVGYIALRLAQSDRAQQRFEGLSAFCQTTGLEAPALLEIEEQSRNLDQRLSAFLIANPAVTGLFVSNDLLAIAIIGALRRLGLSVPGDLSIVGFDGIEFGQMLQPTLATIATDPHAMGQASAYMVLSSILRRPATDTLAASADFEFRPGGSLGRPPSKDALAKKLQLLRQLSPAHASF